MDIIENALTSVRDALLELCPEPIAYLGGDWGQLDLYDDHPPVAFPCVLFDVEEAVFDTLSRQAQRFEATLALRVADYHAVSRPANAPGDDPALRIHRLLLRIHTRLQGLSGEGFSGLQRMSLKRAEREDSIREYVLRFRFSGTDTSACPRRTRVNDVTLDLTAERD